MIAPAVRRKIALISALAAVTAVGAGSFFVSLPVQQRGRVADMLGIMHNRSPGTRLAGAVSNKKPRVSQKLASVVPAKSPRQSRVLAVPLTPAAAVPLLSGAVTPIPAALAPLASPLAAIPAAVATGGGFFIPPIFIPGGHGGGGGGGGTVIPPPGGGGGPPPVPGVPEPQTWLMMTLGFGLVGLLARRRRRTIGTRDSSGVLIQAA